MSIKLDAKMPRSKLFEELILKSWWLIVFFFICFFAYDQAVIRRERERKTLEIKLSELNMQKEQALQHREELQSIIRSFDDPAWIELTLMQGLGLVPEGQSKVVFSNK